MARLWCDLFFNNSTAVVNFLHEVCQDKAHFQFIYINNYYLHFIFLLFNELCTVLTKSSSLSPLMGDSTVTTYRLVFKKNKPALSRK